MSFAQLDGVTTLKNHDNLSTGHYALNLAKQHSTKSLHILCNDGKFQVKIVPCPDSFCDLWCRDSCVHHDVKVNVDGHDTNITHSTIQ